MEYIYCFDHGENRGFPFFGEGLGLLNLTFHLRFPKTYVDFHDERSFEEKLGKKIYLSQFLKEDLFWEDRKLLIL